jgi:hypothetical protein
VNTNIPTLEALLREQFILNFERIFVGFYYVKGRDFLACFWFSKNDIWPCG